MHLQLCCPLGGKGTNSKHLTHYLLIICQTVFYSRIQQTPRNTTIHLDTCYWPPNKCKSIFTLLLAPFWPPPNYVHEMVSNFLSAVCCCANSVNGFNCFFAENSCLLHLKSKLMRVVRVNQKSKVTDHNMKMT